MRQFVSWVELIQPITYTWTRLFYQRELWQLKDFPPINREIPDLNEPKYKESGRKENIPKCLIDQTTGRKYLNESKKTII